MKIEGEYTFDAPQLLVWKALQDPAILGSVMPGGKGFEEVAPNEFSGVLSVKVGPVNGMFTGKITLSDVVEPERYRIAVEGSGPQGRVHGTGSLQLTGMGAQTQMQYEGEAQVSGRIASVGQRLVDASAKSIIRQSLEGLNAYLQVEAQKAALVERDGGEDAGEGSDDASGGSGVTVELQPTEEREPPVYTPPSQSAVALNVATDVAREMIPPSVRPILIGAGALTVVWLVWRLLR